MTVPLPNQIPHASKTTSPDTSANTDRSHPNSKPSKTSSKENSVKEITHTISEGGEKTRDPFICSCGESFVSENDSYRHVKSKKPVFVRTDHLNDRPLRGHEGLQALKDSLVGERKRSSNNTRQPRRSK